MSVIKLQGKRFQKMKKKFENMYWGEDADCQIRPPLYINDVIWSIIKDLSSYDLENDDVEIWRYFKGENAVYYIVSDHDGNVLEIFYVKWR